MCMCVYARERERKTGERDERERRKITARDGDSTMANGRAGPNAKLEKICLESLD